MQLSKAIVILLITIPAWSWNHAVLDGIRGLDDKLRTNTPFFDSFEFSLWSSIRSRVYNPKRNEKKIASRFLKKSVRVAFSISEPENPTLFVYIPGIFNNVNEGQTKRAFERMTQLAPNVLILPNPWGTDYLKAAPIHKPGDILREAESLHDITRSFMEKMNLPKDTRVFLYGASYGGFLATVFANVDRELETNFVDPEVYVFSPPLNMREAISNIDELMYIDDFFNRRISDKDMALMFLDYVFANDSGDLDTKTKILSRELTVRAGFKEPFRDSLRIYFKDKPGYDPKRKDYYFNSYLEELAPELKQLLSTPVADIQYWVVGGRENYNLDIKVLTTNNDFLNNYVYSGAYPADNFWVFESGGHLGFIELPEFEQFLQSTKLAARSTALFTRGSHKAYASR